MFKKAEKKNAKGRVALCGPAGSGKTYSALKIATAMGGKIAVVDTEHGSASKYADLFNFDVVEPETYDPRQLIDFINYAEKNGYSHMIIDSLSHYWMGKGGELELVDNAAARIKGNSFAAWKTVTPIHNDLIEKIIAAKLHIFVTLRTKTEWVLEKDANGKTSPKKIGLTPIMRDGIEFEFDLVGDMDQENCFVVSKSRCPALNNKAISRPGDQIAAELVKWLKVGEVENKPAGSVEKPAKDKIPTKPTETQPKPAELPEKTLAEKVEDARNEPAEFEPEDASVIVDPIPEVKPADRPKKSAVEMANELKELRQLAINAGAKNSTEIKELYQNIIGRDLSAATDMSDDERATVKDALLCM